jgi:3-oxoadipate enol-lactonase
VVPRRPDQRALLSKVTTPVLVIAGAEDATLPLPETIAIAEAIPNAAIAVLEGWRTLPHWKTRQLSTS